MGVTVVDEERGDIDKVLNSLKEALGEILPTKL